MKKSFPFAMRLISLLTALIFSFSGIGSAEMALSGKSAVANTSATNHELSVPAKLGRLESFHRGNTDKTIIHIQTAHGNYESQKQIEAILKQLEETQGITTVLAEGSWEPLHPEFLRYFPENPKLTNKLNDALARKGLLQGSELYLIGSKNAQGYGIEDQQSYIKNAEDFAAVVRAREESRRFLNQMMDGIEKIASAYLGKDLRDFLRRVESFNNGKISLTDWIDELKAQVKNVYSEDLADAGFQSEWPMLVRYFNIQKKEKEMNAANFQSEKKQFFAELTRSDSRQALVISLDSLLSLKSEQVAPSKEELFSVVSDLVQTLPENFNYDRFPTVKALIGILLLQTEIDGQALQNEIEKLTQLLSGKMAKSDAEKKMVNIYQRKILLSKLLELELTSSDYDGLSGPRHPVRSSDFKPSVLLKEISALNSEKRVKGVAFEGGGALDNIFEQAMRFYAGAKARDQRMIDNVEFVMDALKLQKAVVITGGFHAGPFREYFQNKGYSYGLVMPSITKADESGREVYLHGMMEQADFLAKKATIEHLLGISPSGVRSVVVALPEFGSSGRGAADKLELALARSESRVLMYTTREVLKLFIKTGASAGVASFVPSAFAQTKIPFTPLTKEENDNFVRLKDLLTLALPDSASDEAKAAVSKDKIKTLQEIETLVGYRWRFIHDIADLIVNVKEGEETRQEAGRLIAVIVKEMDEKYTFNPKTAFDPVMDKLVPAFQTDVVVKPMQSVMDSLAVMSKYLGVKRRDEALKAIKDSNVEGAKKEKEITELFNKIIAELKKKPHGSIKDVAAIPLYDLITHPEAFLVFDDKKRQAVADAVIDALFVYAEFFLKKDVTNSQKLLRAFIGAIEFVGYAAQVTRLEEFLTKYKGSSVDKIVVNDKPSDKAVYVISVLKSRTTIGKARSESRLVQTFLPVVSVAPRSLIAPTSALSAPELPVDIRGSSAQIVFRPEANRVNVLAPAVISQKIESIPSTTGMNAWFDYLATHPGFIWSLETSRSNKALIQQFRNNFLKAARSAGYQIADNRIRVQLVQSTTFNVGPFLSEGIRVAAVAPDAKTFENFSSDVQLRVMVSEPGESSGASSEFYAGLIATAEALLDSRIHTHGAVKRPRELQLFGGVTFDVILAAVRAFGSAA